jgi:hypothetical protein
VPSGGVSVQYSRPAWRPRTWSVGGHVWVGGGYYPRYRYYRPYYYYTPVPSYYGYYSTSYYPVAPAPAEHGRRGAVASASAVRSRPARRRVGRNRNEPSDAGALARFRLTRVSSPRARSVQTYEES